MILGDLVEIADEGNGKVGTRLSLNYNLFVFGPFIDTVANRAELDQLSSQYNPAKGQVVKVKDIGNGQSAHFIYGNSLYFETGKWFQIEEQNIITLDREDYNSIRYSRWYSESEFPPHSAGTVIKVNDYEEGKPATFVYTTFVDSLSNKTLGETTRIVDNTVADVTALQQLATQMHLEETDRATVLDAGDGTKANFIYYNDGWKKVGTIHEVANVIELDQLQYAETGNVTNVVDNQKFIYSGTEWLPLNEDHDTVPNRTKRDQLSAKNGDIVSVGDADGDSEHFFYADDKWNQRILQGGDAGTITITSRDGIYLSDNSQITTEAKSAGGGNMEINTDGLLRLTNSKVTTSVKSGIGDGGNITLNPQFIILENGQIIAQADEGHGGNIDISTTSIYEFPPKFPPNFDESINANSKSGDDGLVEINSPDTDISGALLVLPANFIDANSQLQSPCSAKIAENLSRFMMVASEGVANAPNDLLSSGPMLLKPSPLKAVTSMKSKNTTAKHSESPFALVAECYFK